MNLATGRTGSAWHRVLAKRSVATLQRWLAAVALLFTLSAAGLLAFIADRHAAMSSTVQAQFQLASTQAGKEFRDLRHVLDLFALGEPSVGAEDLRLRYDILYGRLDVMSRGLFGQALARDPDVVRLLGDIVAQIFGMGDDIAGLDDGDRGRVQPLRDQLAALHRPVARFETAAHQLHAEWLTESRAEILALYLCLAGLFGALAVSVGAFVILLSHQFRLVQASRDELQSLSTDLRLAKEEAEAASRAKSRFLANMSHELRTPLNAIMGFSEMIRDELFGEDAHDRYKEYAGIIHGSGSHLLSLVNDVLDLSRIEAGKFDLDEEAVLVDDTARSCLATIKAAAQERNIALTHADMATGACLMADRRAVKQMLLNVLSNAVKFTPAGGTVSMDLGRLASGGFEFVVGDSGCGMTSDEIDTAVIPFSQINGHLARRHTGAGLGLSITKALIELHQGALVIESTKGAGTTVRLRFPASRVLSGTARVSRTSAA